MTEMYTPLLDSINAENLSQTAYAEALQKKASEIGFDWPFIDGIVVKVKEELDEVSHEIDHGRDPARLLDEMGDLFFACINLARHLDITPDDALAQANEKFYQRFNQVEEKIHQQGKSIDKCSLAELDELWDEVK